MASVTNNKQTPTESDDIDLGKIVGELIDHRKLIIAITTAFTVIAVLYALLATPIYQSTALIQVEQKQGNAILDSLSQMLPDSQPQSAPEIALIQSRMILGKTVDDLNLQAEIEPKYFPIFGRGLARLLGKEPGTISVPRFYLDTGSNDVPSEVTLTILGENNFEIEGKDFL